MDNPEGILHAFKILPDGTAEALGNGILSEAVRSRELSWVHLDARNKKAREWLAREIDYLDPDYRRPAGGGDTATDGRAFRRAAFDPARDEFQP